jgi:hypothetical protein
MGCTITSIRAFIVVCLSLGLSVFSLNAHALTATPAQNMDGNYVLAWSYNGPSDLYESVNGGAWTPAASNASSKSYSGKSAGQYSYYVQQWTQGSQGMVQAGTQGPVNVTVGVAPGTPPNITTPQGSASGLFNVEWSAATGTVGSYKLQRRMNSGAWSPIYTGASLSRPQTLSPGQYQYQVQACNVSGCSPFQVSATVVAVGDGIVVTPATSANGAYTVMWDHNGPTDLYERVNNGSWALVGGNAAEQAFLGKADGTYSYRVEKWINNGTGMVSDGIMGPVTVTVATPQPTLTSSTLNSTDGHFTLSWTQVAGVGKAA